MPNGFQSFQTLEADQQVSLFSKRAPWKTWSETTTPNPSLGNLYRTFEWMGMQEATTNYRVLALFATLIGAIFCLVALFKGISRASTRWHVSPLAVALVLLHLSSDIEFGTLAESTSGPTFWESVKSGAKLIEPLHGVRKYNGPAAFTLITLGVWETLMFILSPLVLSHRHPKSRNYQEWAMYILIMILTATSIDTRIELPLIQRTHKYMSTWETRETMETVVKTVGAFTAVLLVYTGVLALILDAVLFDGCMIDSLAGPSALPLDGSPMRHPVYVDGGNASVPASQRTSERSVNPEIDIAAHVENFLWKQMCTIKQATQGFQSSTISPGKDSLSTAYLKLGQAYSALLPVKPVLDGLISMMQERNEPVEHYKLHLATVDEALKRMEVQMKNLNAEHTVIGFVRGGPDPDMEGLIANLNYDAERFIHIHLDRQEVKEEMMEAAEDVEILEDELAVKEDDYPMDFSGQLYTQMDIIELRIRQILEKFPANRLSNHAWRTEQPEDPAKPTEGLQLVTEVVVHAQEPAVPAEKSLLFSNNGDCEEPETCAVTKPIVTVSDDSKTSPRKVSSIPVRQSPIATDENAEPLRGKYPRTGVKKSAGHMVVGLWSSAATLEFRSDNFLRGSSSSDLLNPDDLLAIGELGRYLTSKLRGNRAETAAASKILINLEKAARTAKDNSTALNVGANNLNYFRSCMWLGQARLTRFPPPSQDRLFTEIPIEGIIKLAGYGPDGIKSLNMLPLPKETWTDYLERLSGSLEIKKIKELHEWLERYLGGVPALLTREVPRAEGWDTGVPLDANRCLYRHLENMMLLPPYPAEIEKALSIQRIEKADDPNFVGSTLVEKVLSSPKANDTIGALRFQPL